MRGVSLQGHLAGRLWVDAGGVLSEWTEWRNGVGVCCSEGSSAWRGGLSVCVGRVVRRHVVCTDARYGRVWAPWWMALYSPLTSTRI